MVEMNASCDTSESTPPNEHSSSIPHELPDNSQSHESHSPGSASSFPGLRDSDDCTDNSDDIPLAQTLASKGCEQPAMRLTREALTEQNKVLDAMDKAQRDAASEGLQGDAFPLSKTNDNSIRAWAANLPDIPDSIEPVAMGPSHIFEFDEKQQGPQIQETKDVFTETQKIAYVGLCALTSLEVVHDFQGKDYAYARMSADNWQRKLMRAIYAHMDISKEEIKMIQSLSVHDIRPDDLVHQFTSQGETTTVNLDGFCEIRSEQAKDASPTGDLPDKDKAPEQSVLSEETKTQASDKDEFVIDLRWTVMCDLFLLCLGNEDYDARSRVFIARMASILSLDWLQVIRFEKRIVDHLLQSAEMAWETETTTSIATTMTAATCVTTSADMDVSIRNDKERVSRNKQRKKRRYVMIGLATLGGGLILGLSAGLMAPVIAGGIGAILTTAGVTGTSGFLGGTAGIALITGGATMAGSGIGARSMGKRMKTVDTFEFIPVHLDDHVNCIITISGWLPKSSDKKDRSSLPFSVIDPMMGDHYNLFWEPEMLEALGSAFKIFATEAVTFSIQQALAHTIMGALLSGLAWPLAMTKLGYLVDNPWLNGLDRARLAGLILADSLMNRNLGARPVTLVGYSLGARVIFYCLLELNRLNAYGLVENVALFGTPVSGSKKQWKDCTTVVSGRFINGYATNDWLLGFLFRASTAGLGNVAGLRPLAHIEGNRVQNLDCTDLIKGHLSYREAMPRLLKRAGFVVTSEELPTRDKDSKEEEEIDMPSLHDLEELQAFRPATKTKEASSISSFSCGKASIKYPTATTTDAPPPSKEKTSLSPSSQPVTLQDQETVIPSLPPPQRSHSSDSRSEPSNSKSSEEDTMFADILAKAEAASKSPKAYSSLSNGNASIASLPLKKSTSEIVTNATRDTVSEDSTRRSISSSSLFSKSLFKNRKKTIEELSSQEIKDAGVPVKEIKSTLGRMVVPQDVVNPMPKITLEKPQYARINR